MRITLGFRWASAALALCALAGPNTVLALTTEFNFDALSLTGTHITSGGIDQGATLGSSGIQAYMNSQLLAGSVAVAGAIANSGYTGDNKVNQVLNSSTGSGTIYGTLAHMADVNDAGKTAGKFYSTLNHVFLMNDNFGGLSAPSAAKSLSFTMAFTGITISSISFDWEIFPNATCQNNAVNSSCPPTLKLSTNINSNVHTYTAPTGTQPQAIGGLDTWSFAAGTNSLTFTDWPAEIGIRGFLVNYVCVPGTPPCNGNKVPEPGSLALVGIALVGAGLTLRRRKLNG
jgi:hypothetical protein